MGVVEIEMEIEMRVVDIEVRVVEIGDESCGN